MSRFRFGKASYLTINRYIISEFLFSFFIAFLFFFFIFFVNQLLLLAEEILAKRVTLGKVARLILYSLPAILAFTFPFSSLLGALMAIGRLSSDREIIALRASGVSHRRIFLPVLLLGILFSGISFFTNDYLLPRGTVSFSRLYRDILYSNPALELEPYSIKRYQDIVISTGRIEGTTIFDLLLIDTDKEGNHRIITASEALLKKDKHDQGTITLQLKQVFGHTVKEARGAYDYFSAASMDYSILLSSFSFNITNLTPREMSAGAVWKDIRKMEIGFAVRKNEWEKTLEEKSELYREDPSPSLELALKRLQNNPPFDRTLQLYRIEFHKKVAIPFGCLAFMFFAFPAGLIPKRSGRMAGFGLGLLIALFYWALLFAGQTLGLRFQFSPLLSMWIPNLAVLLLGLSIYIIRRIR
jgi:lipopolysaccharide export system permease protein